MAAAPPSWCSPDRSRTSSSPPAPSVESADSPQAEVYHPYQKMTASSAVCPCLTRGKLNPASPGGLHLPLSHQVDPASPLQGRHRLLLCC